MQCDQSSDLLATYLDGELGPEQAAALQQHLSGCTRCAAEIAERVSLRRGLGAARGRFVPSADFRRKMQQQMAAPKKRSVFLWLMPLAIAVAAMLLVTIGWMQHSARSDAFREVADLHINAMASANPLDVVSTDRHTVKPWFQGRIPFSFNVPELAGSEFTLLGGRMVYLHQQPGAQLIVGMRQHKISVLIFQNAGWGGSLAMAGGVATRNSFHVATWQSGGLRFFVIGDVEPAEVEKLAELFKKVNG